jgi:hypothetical protein
MGKSKEELERWLAEINVRLSCLVVGSQPWAYTMMEWRSIREELNHASD